MYISNIYAALAPQKQTKEHGRKATSALPTGLKEAAGQKSFRDALKTACDGQVQGNPAVAYWPYDFWSD